MSSINNSTQNSNEDSSIGSHRRKTQYRALLDQLSSLDNENNNNNDQSIELCANKTIDVVDEAKALFTASKTEDKAKHPGETYLDSRVLSGASDVAVRCSEAVSGNVNLYDKHELAFQISQNPEFWSFSFPFEVPKFAFMYGTFDPVPQEQRPRAPRRHVERQRTAALTAPQNVDRLQKADELPQMVNRVNRYIKKTYEKTRKPVSYFHTVLDPGSFSATIENIYYMSFLVQDCLISVQIDETSGLPFIKPVSSADKEKADLADKNQFVVSMDFQMYQELIKAFEITTPAMSFKR